MARKGTGMGKHKNSGDAEYHNYMMNTLNDWQVQLHETQDENFKRKINYNELINGQGQLLIK